MLSTTLLEISWKPWPNTEADAEGDVRGDGHGQVEPRFFLRCQEILQLLYLVEVQPLDDHSKLWERLDFVGLAVHAHGCRLGTGWRTEIRKETSCLRH